MTPSARSLPLAHRPARVRAPLLRLRQATRPPLPTAAEDGANAPVVVTTTVAAARSRSPMRSSPSARRARANRSPSPPRSARSCRRCISTAATKSRKGARAGHPERPAAAGRARAGRSGGEGSRPVATRARTNSPQQQLIARSQLDTQRATRDRRTRAGRADARATRRPRRSARRSPACSASARSAPARWSRRARRSRRSTTVARVYVDFPVPEADARATSPPGQQRVRPQRRLSRCAASTARSARSTRAWIQATRAVTVRADFPNDDRALRPGMLVQVDLHARATHRRCWCRRSRSCRSATDSFVYRVKPDGSVEQADVQDRHAPRRPGGNPEGLKAGDRIVVDGTGKLRPGAKISRHRGGAAPHRAGEAG